MAFCPLCGKKLPDNGRCVCGRMVDENGNIVEIGSDDSLQTKAVEENVPEAIQPITEPEEPLPEVVSLVQVDEETSREESLPVHENEEPPIEEPMPIQDVEETDNENEASSSEIKAPEVILPIQQAPAHTQGNIKMAVTTPSVIVPIQQAPPWNPPAVKMGTTTPEKILPIQQAPPHTPAPVQMAVTVPSVIVPIEQAVLNNNSGNDWALYKHPENVISYPPLIPKEPEQAVYKAAPIAKEEKKTQETVPAVKKIKKDQDAVTEVREEKTVKENVPEIKNEKEVEKITTKQQEEQSSSDDSPTVYEKSLSQPGLIGEVVGMFMKILKNPLGANEEALDGKFSFKASLLLGGIYCFVVWISLMLLLLGNGGHFRFLPSLGYGLLGGIFFSGIRFAAAALISLFAKNSGKKVLKVYSAMCVNTLLLDCILAVMMLFQFITVYFAVFFMLVYLGLVFYQNTMLLKKLSKNSEDIPVRTLCFNGIMFSMYAVLLAIAYSIYNSALAKNIWSWF